MKELTIHHFPTNGQASARVRVSYRSQEGAQAQERESDFGFVVTEKQRRDIQWYLEEYLIYPWGEFRNRARQVEELMEQLGIELFDAVFGSRQTGALYAHVADDLANTRIAIHAYDTEGIALPWELMRDSTRGEYGDLARLAWSFVRSQPDLIFQPSPAPGVDEKFNILMVICRPGGSEGDVPFQSVARPLLELFRPYRDDIRLDILRPPTFEQLTSVLNDKRNFYHVLHFDGHGAFPQGAGTQGLLSFEGENDERRLVTGAELGSLLAGKGVPVILLNACQSGMTHPEAIYPSVGNDLLKAGTRGVVAMAYSVYVQSAVRFMARLYESLIKGDELSRAVALAREDLRANPQRQSPIGEIPLRDWVVPVLFEAAPVKATSRPHGDLHLSPDILNEQQAEPGTEIDCPEPPAFGFVGRDGVTLDLERAFRTESIVLLEGMAGVGKTEMAAGFARWWGETGALGGPIFFFRFEHYLPLARVCDRVGQVFGEVIRQQLKVEWHLLDADTRRRVALSVLKQIPCLLIWDNFEPVAGFPKGTPSAWKPEEQKELRDFLSGLRGGRTKLLLTSRRDESWLGNIYRCVQLTGLKLIEAQELAVRVLRRAGLNLQQIKALPQYNELLKYLRGNPLAIQTILPELKRTTPDALLRALQAGEVRLNEDDPAQKREHSLSASLTYRLDALDPALRRRLSLLALFQGFVNTTILEMMSSHLAAPEIVKGLSLEQWRSALDAAAEVGLLRFVMTVKTGPEVESACYTIHPALSWFFHDLLRETFPQDAAWLERTFSTSYGMYGHVLENSFRAEPEFVMSILREEEHNFRQAHRFALRGGHWLISGFTLMGIRMLLVPQGRWVEWERVLTETEAVIIDEGGRPLVGREDLWVALMGHRSEIARHQHQLDTEEAIHRHLKEHFEREGDDRNHAIAVCGLGLIAIKRRQFDEAERLYLEALPIAERAGDEGNQTTIFNQLGEIARERRQFKEAKEFFQKSLSIAKRAGHIGGQSLALTGLGLIALAQKEFDEAERLFQESLSINSRVNDQERQARNMHNLGTVAEEKLQFKKAEYWYRSALAIFEQTGNERRQTSTLHQLGTIAMKQEHYDEAEGWFSQVMALNERLGDTWGRAACLNQMGLVKMGQGKNPEAIQFLEQAEALFTDLGDPHSLAKTRSVLEWIRSGNNKTEEESQNEGEPK